MLSMTEDDIYRTSTQYRLWSFTSEALASIRLATNALAADRVRAAIKRKHGARTAERSTNGRGPDGTENGEGTENDRSGEGADREMQVECLTVEEEQKLVGFYCVKAMELADFCNFPTNVKATAVQYLKRFYLSNSPMTYHPKQIMPSALYLSTKTENHYTALKSFASKFPKTTPEDVIAPEFLVTQGLRFTFDVRHPHRGLEGGFMELLALASGEARPPPHSTKTSMQLQLEFVQVHKGEKGSAEKETVEELKNRIRNAHGKAKELLKSSALLTDAYFLYTPAQIWLSALLIVDEPLCLFYLDTKLDTPATTTPTIRAKMPMKSKLVTALRSCASLLRSSSGATVTLGPDELKELKRIDKKLYDCRNPEKLDLVGINKAQKREGEGGAAGTLDEKIVKKRKLEREASLKEAEAVFGPELGG